jgi:hypothetical protein
LASKCYRLTLKLDPNDVDSEVELAIEPKKVVVSKGKKAKTKQMTKPTTRSKPPAKAPPAPAPAPPAPVSSTDVDDKPAVIMTYVPPAEISYRAAYHGKYQLESKCSATSFNDAVRAWAHSCAIPVATEDGLPGSELNNLPLFAYKYSTSLARELPNIIRDAASYKDIVDIALEREKERNELKQEGKKIPGSLPSMLPLMVAPVELPVSYSLLFVIS